MKRLLQIFLAFSMVITMIVPSVACGKTGNNEPIDPIQPETPALVVDVMEAPYRAAGDGITSDRAIIQRAICDVSKLGGGVVQLTAGHTFLSGNLYLENNVELRFGDGARLIQNSNEDDYVYPIDEVDKDGTEHKIGDSWIPEKGSHYSGDTQFAQSPWNHAFVWNFPLIFARQGLDNVGITGKGTITMWHDNCASAIHLMVFACYDVTNVTLSDFTVDGHNGWTMETINSKNILVKNVTIKGFQCGCTDGLHIIECQDVRVTGCDFNTGDDALSLASFYGDPRYFRWCNINTQQVCKNIEIDHNKMMVSDPANMKGLAIFYWAKRAPDMSQIEYSNINIHDNDFCSVGVWDNDAIGSYFVDPYYVFSEAQGWPVKSIRWANNKVDNWQDSFFNLFKVSELVSDDSYMAATCSLKEFKNGDFDYAKLGYWVSINENGSVAECKADGENNYGYLGNLEKGDAKLYQGLYLKDGQYTLNAKVKTGDGAKVQLFVCNQAGKLIASKVLEKLDDWTDVSFTFELDEMKSSILGNNYRIGIERVNAKGWACIDDVALL